MAQRIIGLDLGARNIRVAVVESTLRTVEIKGVDVEPVLQIPDSVVDLSNSEEPEKENQEEIEASLQREAARLDAIRDSTQRALKNLAARGSLEADHVVAALPGDMVVSRILEFPFTDPKRLDQVVAFELEEHIPFDLDDVLVDHCILSTDGDTAQVLASAVLISDVAEILNTFSEVGLDPRILSLSPFAYKKVFDYQYEEEENPERLPCTAIVDIGHLRTDITVFNRGELAFARTVRRGGDFVIRNIGGDGVDPRATERLIAAHGRILSPEMPQADVESQALSEAIQRSLQPIFRDINQTLRSHERISSEPVDKIYLTGGLAQLPGLKNLMAKVLEIPTEVLSELPPTLANQSVSRQDICAVTKPIGLALELIRGGSHEALNFRKGPFAYKGDFQYLVERAPTLMMMAAALLVAVGGWYGVARANLIEHRQHLRDDLSSFTKQVTGRSIEDPQLAQATIMAPPTKGYMEALPQRTGIWVFSEVSAAVEEVRRSSPPSSEEQKPKPPEDNVEGDRLEEEKPKEKEYDMEVERFEFNGNQGIVKGQARVLEALELFVQILRSKSCFSKVTVEDTDKIAFERHRGWLTFEITYQLDCKSKAKAKNAKAAAKQKAEKSAAPGEKGDKREPEVKK